MTTSNTTTPAITSNDLIDFINSCSIGHTQFKLYFTAYKSWSGKSYYGRRSGVTASDDYRMVTVERVTTKAVMFKSNAQSVWVPISRLKVIEDGSLRVNKGFCYYNGGLKWQTYMPPRTANGVLGGTAVYSPYRRTII